MQRLRNTQLGKLSHHLDCGPLWTRFLWSNFLKYTGVPFTASGTGIQPCLFQLTAVFFKLHFQLSLKMWKSQSLSCRWPYLTIIWKSDQVWYSHIFPSFLAQVISHLLIIFLCLIERLENLRVKSKGPTMLEKDQLYMKMPLTEFQWRDSIVVPTFRMASQTNYFYCMVWMTSGWPLDDLWTRQTTALFSAYSIRSPWRECAAQSHCEGSKLLSLIHLTRYKRFDKRSRLCRLHAFLTSIFRWLLGCDTDERFSASKVRTYTQSCAEAYWGRSSMVLSAGFKMLQTLDTTPPDPALCILRQLPTLLLCEMDKETQEVVGTFKVRVNMRWESASKLHPRNNSSMSAASETPRWLSPNVLWFQP